MHISEDTHSFKSLFSYALPYAVGYTLLPYFLIELGFMVDGLLSTIFVTLVLNAVVIFAFRKRQHRSLQKVECSRIALLSMLLTLIISMATLYLSDIGESWAQMNDSNIYQIAGIAGLVAFVINYAVVFYSLWLMQRFWKP